MREQKLIFPLLRSRRVKSNRRDRGAGGPTIPITFRHLGATHRSKSLFIQMVRSALTSGRRPFSWEQLTMKNSTSELAFPATKSVHGSRPKAARSGLLATRANDTDRRQRAE